MPGYEKSRVLLSEINVTPFVDVMLVLLIIFMVTAPMLTQGLQVELPKTRTVEAMPTDADHLVLSVSEDGAVFLDQEKVAFKDLPARLKALVVEPGKKLFLKADKNARYGRVVKVMGEIKLAGVSRLSVAAEKEDED